MVSIISFVGYHLVSQKKYKKIPFSKMAFFLKIIRQMMAGTEIAKVRRRANLGGKEMAGIKQSRQNERRSGHWW